MITPRFFCSQTDSSLTISIHCPSIRASEVEIHAEDVLVTIHVNPYYLRLHLPGPVLEDDASSASYDPGPGTLTVVLTKAQPGQVFKDLDLLARLLAPPPKETTTPSIEVLDSQETEDEELSSAMKDLDLDAEKKEILEAAANDWALPQAVPAGLPELHTSRIKPYGFLGGYTGYFTHVGSSENEVNELGPDAETCPPSERRRRRTQKEDEKFDEEHYMADFADPEYIDELVSWRWPMPAASTSSSGEDTMDYTEEEKLIMLRLPRKEYLFTAAQAHSVRLTLVGLLFAYAYDARTTQLDQTPESAWTICSLIPVFAGLDPPPYTTTPPGLDPSASLRHDISTTLQASYRRALAYPLFRSWTLCEACRQDVARIFGSGKRQVVRALLDLKKTLDKNDIYYVYSKIWVDDMLVWVMIHFDEDGLSMLAQALKNTRVEKHSLGWKLDQLEATVRAVQTGEDGGDSDDEDVIPDSDDDDEV